MNFTIEIPLNWRGYLFESVIIKPTLFNELILIAVLRSNLLWEGVEKQITKLTD